MKATKYYPWGNVSFRGKKYVLFRRGEAAGSPFSVRLMHEGKRHLVSTGTGDLALAKAKAKILIGDILDGVQPESARPTRSSVTVGDVIDAYAKGDRHVIGSTANEYERAMLRLVSVAKGVSKEEARSVKVTELTGDLVRKFQALKQGGHSVDYVTPRKANTGINSTVRQARGIFSRKAILGYERAGLIIPETIQTFLKAPYLRELSHRYSDNPIPQEQIDQLNTDLPDLKKQDERLWAIHLMIRLMGLRASEIERAKRHWLVERGGMTYLVINRREGEAAPKRSDGEVPVPEVLLGYFQGHDDEFLIPAKTKSERYELIRIIHSKWVAARVPGRTKTNHELRKWAGSVVATKTNSWERAAEFLRIDIETAKAHYLSFVTPSDPLSLEDLVG